MKISSRPRSSLVLSSLGALVLVAVASPGCGGAFGKDPETLRFDVRLVDTTDVGSRENRKVIAVDPPDSYTFSVEALNRDGERDTSFDGWLRVSSKPGNVVEVSGDDVVGRNIHLKGGFIQTVTTQVSRAYGDTRIVVEDLGYTPADPARDPAPACADGIDNDGDGAIDFPADPECAFANDDTETGGSYAAGASDPLYYRLPRAAEVRGYQSGGSSTPFKSQSVQVDTGYREETRDYDFTMVVTRLSSNGFYVADLEDDRPEEERIGYAGLFAFNFNTPGNLGYCDRLRRLSGTATEFFGSIQLGYPTWSAVRWNPDEPCLIPEPRWLKSTEIEGGDLKVRLQFTHSLVRVRTGDYDVTTSTGVVQHRSTVRITKFLGPEHPLQNPDGTWRISENASNCDFNGDDAIDFSTDPERSCAQACTEEEECTEWSNFATRSNFNFVVEDVELLNGAPSTEPKSAKIQGNGSTSPTFSALALRGQPVRSFSGTLGYFSGGNQFTIEARCSDDIVIELEKEPIASNTACVTRAEIDNDEER